MSTEIRPCEAETSRKGKRKFSDMERSDSKHWKEHYDAYKSLIPDQYCPHRLVFEDALRRKANGDINIDSQHLLATYYRACSEMFKYSLWPQTTTRWSGAICQMYMEGLVANV
jgi:hypothetical protein